MGDQSAEKNGWLEYEKMGDQSAKKISDQSAKIPLDLHVNHLLGQ